MSGEGLLANAPQHGPDDAEDPDVNDWTWPIVWARVAHATASTRPFAHILPESKLRRLGCDELDCLTITMDLEEALGLSIPDDTITCVSTTGEIADALLALIQEKRK